MHVFAIQKCQMFLQKLNVHSFIYLIQHMVTNIFGIGQVGGLPAVCMVKLVVYHPVGGLPPFFYFWISCGLSAHCRSNLNFVAIFGFIADSQPIVQAILILSKEKFFGPLHMNLADISEQ